MKKLFFILIFANFLSFNSFAKTCSDIDINPVISVTYSFGNLVFDTSKSTEEITEMAKEFKLVESEVFAEGLAVANVNFDISIQTSASPIGINSFCVIPSKVNVFIGLSKPTIYISNSLQEGSCKYNIVLRHEKTHQQINKTTLEYYLPIFKAAATNIVKKIPATPINNTNQIEMATRDLTEKYSSKIMPLVDFIKKEIANEQFKLDNKANYKYENMLCQN